MSLYKYVFELLKVFKLKHTLVNIGFIIVKILVHGIDSVKQAGLTAADEEISDWLRKNFSDKYIILAVNKCESPRKGIMQASEFWSLG